MKLSEFQTHLKGQNTLTFVRPDGGLVPGHFHITEVGLITKHFIDCGGKLHLEKAVNMQIWVANDMEHRLTPKALLNIIELSKKVLGGEDLEIEFEYQTETVGKYGVGIQGEAFALIAKQTDCLAKSNCGIPESVEQLNPGKLEVAETGCCKPGGGCC